MVEYPSVIGYQHQLCSSRACVDTQVSVALICTYISITQVALLVAVDEFVILGLRIEKWLTCYDIIGCSGICHLIYDILYMICFLGVCRIDSTAVCYENRSFLRENCVFVVETESVHESLSQSLQEEQRTAEEKDFSLDSTSLSET